MKYDIKCASCKRYLGTTNKSTEVDIKCSNSACKKLHTYKVVFMSDLMGSGHHSMPQAVDKNDAEINELKEKLAEMDGRTKEAKELKLQLEELQGYVAQLEGVIDGQG